MIIFTRKILACILFLFLFAFIPVLAFSDNGAGDGSTGVEFTPLLNVARGTEIAGGIITLGFGIWHFFVPSLYGWWGYFDDDPAELHKAVGATNFFFSAFMSTIGAMSIILPSFFPEAKTINTVWLWINSALWMARFIYQAVSPQGTQIQGVAPAMTVGFALTDLLFIFSAVTYTVSH